MRKLINTSLFIASIALSAQGQATGLATCDSGPESGWQSSKILQGMLEEQGWKVRRIKVDGGCYEVYALNDQGKRVEAYFHPVTLEPVPTSKDE